MFGECRPRFTVRLYSAEETTGKDVIGAEDVRIRIMSSSGVTLWFLHIYVFKPVVA